MNSHRSLHRRGRLFAALVTASLLGVGCSNFQPTFEHRTRVDAYTKRFLSTRTAVGAEWLEVEANHDASVRAFVAREGTPDYLYVVDAERLHLFYPRRDFAATFQRSPFKTTSEVTRLRPIPKELASLLPQRARQQIAAVRKARR